MSKIFKVLAAILGVLGFIGSIASSSVLGEFSFTLFLGSFISVALLCIVLYAIGQLLDNQELILDRISALEASQKKSAVSRPSASLASRPAAVINDSQPANTSQPQVSRSSGWTCHVCGTANPLAANKCSHCKAERN